MTEPRERQVVHKGSVGEDDLDDRSAAEARTAVDDDVPDAELDGAEPDGAEPDDAEPDDDDDAVADDGGADRTRVEHHPGGRRRVAPLLFMGAAALWIGVMALRCRPAHGPSANVPSAEPTVADDVPVAPTPIAPGPTRADATPPDPIPAADAEAQPDGGPTDDAPPAEGDRLPQRRNDWAEGLEIPTKVRYTVRRGGSLENVANLFKIYHHEILELNPGIAIDQELAPNTRVVIWSQKPGEKSESIGYPSDGSLAGAIPMVEGPGRRILAIGWKTWGKDTSIAMLDRVLDRWAERGSNVQPILVGNIANRTGGRLEPHSTHQSGRDVDLGYPQKLAAGAELNWQEMTAANLDAAETWALLFLLGETGAVEEIYIDREIQKLLHEHALGQELLSKSALSKWMEYPRPTGTAGTLITHVAGHTDHMHVRWSCTSGDGRCKSR
ncbi:MAG: penicillin-insensitive murein endopeptidase [Myxococcales bacterium]|nr:penicillin-insensitive murein endopeptidase [Myxococcales bacterium]